jgi:hypothetical protein
MSSIYQQVDSTTGKIKTKPFLKNYNERDKSVERGINDHLAIHLNNTAKTRTPSQSWNVV